MKKNLCLFLPLLLTAALANAQVVPDLTTYRGAFAPAPEPMWTDTWTNWDPQNAAYPATTVTVSGTITTNTTWTSNNVYKLSGVVYVDTLATLTIQPGTIIRGDETVANSSLIVTRGGKLIAEGTVCNPIVFTSNKAAGQRAKADWGGVILLGKARNNQGTNTFIEGLSQSNLQNYYGGNDDNDNSGSLKYVRIEFGGYVFATNNEINGLTLGSVGRQTKIDYVQCSFINDDAFEWFGGTVNCKHLVAYRCLDDNFDTDLGWSGYVQYALGVRDPAISDDPAVSTSESFESDNDPAGTNPGVAPKTSGSFYNVTAIGAYRCASNANGSGVGPTANGFRRGARLRRNTDLKIVNSILMAHKTGLFLNNNNFVLANVDEDSCVFRNNIIAADFSTSFTSPSGNGLAVAAEDQPTRDRLFRIEYANDSVNTCSLLTNAWDFLNPDYRPNVAGAGAIVTDVTNLSTGADIAAVVEIDGSLFTANQSRDLLVDVLENGGGATNGIITVTIPKPSGWNITVPGLTLTNTNQSGINGTSNVNGGTPNTNGNWNFRQDANNVYATSKPGTVISKFGFVQLGFTATRKATTSTGTNQSLGVNVSGGSDNTPANNATVQGLSAN